MPLAVVILNIVIAAGQAAPGPEPNPVWWWFATCGGPLIIVEVKVQGTIVAKVQIPLCRASRESRGAQGGAGRIDFTFRPLRAIVWTGYHDDDDNHTPAGQLIEGSLWEAGADPDALLIGVGFAAAHRGLLNTIHLAYPYRRSESTIAKGITVATYPSGR